MRTIAVLLVIAFGILSANAANAKTGDAAWAQCIWQKNAEAADNWLALQAPTWTTDTQDKNSALGLLLVASCATEAANELKPNRAPNWKLIASVLKANRQPGDGGSTAASSPVHLCQNFVEIEGKRELYRIDIKRIDQDGSSLLVFQQHFANFEGKAVKLPQDLRAMPTEKDGKLTADCKVIAKDGGLIDA